MGAQFSKQVERRKAVAAERRALADLLESAGDQFPGSDFRPPTARRGCRPSAPTSSGSARSSGRAPTTPPPTRSASASSPGPSPDARTAPSTASSSTAPASSTSASRRPPHLPRHPPRFSRRPRRRSWCSRSARSSGTKTRRSSTSTWREQLGEVLIPQDEAVFGKTVAEVLPREVICVWKPRKSPAPKHGDPLWSSGYLRDNWIDTDLPKTKFDSNMRHLGEQPPVSERRYFYRVENTVTPQADNPVVCVKPVTGRIHGYARLFISQAFVKGSATGCRCSRRISSTMTSSTPAWG
uniref:Uncharacterized protein n=1 Tax=Ananas comosus var. bracteatus TaxID=296719 RepID=A0A6V7NRW5_ANACO|nr:unnamed protein product [Ananas comosus var. bracteatus]